MAWICKGTTDGDFTDFQLYSAPPQRAVSIPGVSLGAACVLVVLAILLIWFGVYPTSLLNLIRTTVAGLN